MGTIVDALIWSMFAQTWQIAIAALAGIVATRYIFATNPRAIYAMWLVVMLKCCVPPLWKSSISPLSWGQSCVEQFAANVSEPLVTWPRLELDRNASHEREIVNGQEASLSVRGANQRGENGTVNSLVKQNSLAAARDLGVCGEHVAVDWIKTFVSSNISGTIVTIWGLGVTYSAILLWVRYRRLTRSSQVTADEICAVQAIVDEIRHRLVIKRSVRVMVTSDRIGPMAFGLWRPTILIPAELVRNLENSRLRVVLAHELMHVQRGDLWSGLLHGVASIIWWFHPCVRYVGRRLVESIERCCDEQVVSELGYSAGDYARTLVDVLELKHASCALPVYPGIRSVEITQRRLESIMTLEKGCSRRPAWRHWAVLVVGGLLLLPGQSLGKGEADEDEPTKKSIVMSQLKEEPEKLPRKNKTENESNAVRGSESVGPGPTALDPAVRALLDRESLKGISLLSCVQFALRNRPGITVDGTVDVGSTAIDSVQDKLVVRTKSSQEENVRALLDARLAEVSYGYWELWFFYKNIESAKLSHDQALRVWQQGAVNQAKNRSEHSTTQLARMSEQYFFFKARVEEAFRDLERTESRLRFLTGYQDLTVTLRPTDNVEATPPGLSTEELVQVAMSTHAHLRRERALIARREHELELLRIKITSQFLSTPIVNGDRDVLAGAGSAELALRRDKELLDVASKEIAQGVRQIATEIPVLCSAWSSASKQVELTEHAVKLANEAFVAGLSDVSELLDAQRRHCDAQIHQSQIAAEVVIGNTILKQRLGLLASSFAIELVVEAD